MIINTKSFRIYVANLNFIARNYNTCRSCNFPSATSALLYHPSLSTRIWEPCDQLRPGSFQLKRDEPEKEVVIFLVMICIVQYRSRHLNTIYRIFSSIQSIVYFHLYCQLSNLADVNIVVSLSTNALMD